jgi:hypothetical protein
MKKKTSLLIDELSITNIKIYMLIDKIYSNKHTREDAMKVQHLNKYRSDLCNALDEEFGQTPYIKLYEEGK